MFQLARRRLLIVGLVLLSLFLGGATLNQTIPECPQGETLAGCAQVTLNPSGATGDFYVDGVLVAPAQNPGWLMLTPDVEHTIEVRNIRSTEENFGTLFNYSDIPVSTIKVKAGETKVKTIRLAKSYIRGTLKFTCDIKNLAPTDAVSCRVTIDGAVQPDVIAGQAASYTLDPGDRLVLVEIVGEQAGLFDPASKEQKVKIAAGTRSTNLKVTFTRKGHLLLGLDQAGVVADFYLDGTQIATQVATYDMWVSPNRNHKIEAKNFTDPAAAGAYTWKDARQNVNVRAGAEKAVTFQLKKQYLKGFLVVKCNIANLPSAYCVPTFDGIGQAAIAAGASAQYTLDLGAHSVVITPGPAGSWKPASVSRNMTVWAGQTQTIRATFEAVTVVLPTNLIVNPGFEGGSIKESGNLTVPLGWHAWSSCSDMIHSELEAHPPHVMAGSFAARVWQPYNICQMGFYQQVNVVSGGDYLLTAHGFSWSTGNPVVGSLSEANINMRIGIDPNGGANPFAASIVWSNTKAAMDAYGEFKVGATARNSVITIVLRSVPDWGMARNDTFWDETSLLMVVN